ncbi:MAG: DUF1631 domain-containing protein [Gammaproteobacteria bacterium]
MATAKITPITQPRSTGLFRECAVLARERLTRALDEVMAQTDDLLFKLANSADSSQRQNLYFDAMRELRLKRDTIARNFVNGFERSLTDGPALARERAGSKRGDRGGFTGELSLLEIGEVEENLAIANFCDSLKSRCGRELAALDQRLTALLAVPQLDEELNPFAPQSIGMVLKRALAVLESGLEVRLTLYKMFDKAAGHGLQQMYAELNQRLIDAGILPSLTSPTAHPGVTRRTRVTIESETDSVEASGDDMFSTLQQLLQGGGPAGSGTHGQTGNGPGGPGAPGPSIVQLGVAGGASGQSQRGGAAGWSGGGAGGDGFASVPMLVETLTQLQRRDPSGALAGDVEAATVYGSRQGSGLRALRGNESIGNMAPPQDLTLEIVSLLFDHILEDRSIPDAIKALIGRLQIPLLKVAILDKNVFSRRMHPARRLLDTLAAAAVGWYEGLPQSDRLYDKIEQVVNRITNHFDDDVSLFAEVLEDFEAFIADEEAAAENRAEISSRSLRTREQLVLAKLEVDSALGARLADVEIHDFVTQFIKDYWRQLLIITHVEAGCDSEQWAAQLGAVDELAWSVQPKTTREDRKDLSARLPKLLKQLRAGMLELEMEPTVCSKFFSMLASVHVAAIKTIEESCIAARHLARQEAEHAAVPETRSQTAAAAEDPSSEAFIAQGLARLFERQGVEPETLDIDLSAFEDPDQTVPDGRLEAVDPELAPFVEQITTLDPGDWVEFDCGDGSNIRARFTFISPASGRYLFTSRQGEKMLDSSLTELAREFQAGGARIIKAEADPLFDRVLADMVEKLEGRTAPA